MLIQVHITWGSDSYWQKDSFNFEGNLDNFKNKFYGHKSSHRFFQDMKELLQELINNNREDEVTCEVLYNMQEIFLREAHSKYGQISSTLEKIKLDEDIVASAGGSYDEKSHSTHA